VERIPESLLTAVLAGLRARLSRYKIVFEAIEDDEGAIGVGVFNVETDRVRWVRQAIHELDGQLLVGTEFCLIPMVRDQAVTREFYPEHAEAWINIDPPLVEEPWVGIEPDLSQPLCSSVEGVSWCTPLHEGSAAEERTAANQEFAIAA